MVAIARALLNDNRVLLVDEPTKGLAPALVADVARVLERLAELTTVLLVEQNLGVVRADRARRDRARPGPRRARGRRAGAARAARARQAAAERGERTHEHVPPADGHRRRARRDVLPDRLRPVAHLRADGRAQLRARRVHHRRRLRDVVDVDARVRRRPLDAVALPAQRAARPRLRRRLRRARRARPDPPALRAAHRAGARHGRPAARVRRARSPASGARTRRRSSCRRGCTATTDVGGAHIPNDRWVEIATAARRARAAPAVPAQDALRADHPRRRREPRDGAGARHRRAQGVHARVRDRRRRGGDRRRAQRRLLQRRRARAGDEPADLRVHRRRHRRPRVDRRLGGRRGRRRADAAVHELLRDPPASATWSSCCCSGSCCSRARAASPAPSSERAHEDRRVVLDWVWPLAVFGALAFVPKLGFSIPKLFDQPIDSPGTLALLAPASSSAALALTYDIQFGYTGLLSFGHALYIALGVYLANIAITDWHWSFWRVDPLHDRRRASCSRTCSASSRCASAASRSRWSRSRSRRPARCSRSRTRTTGRTARRGSAPTTRSCRQAFVGIVNTKNLYWLALGFLAVVFFVVRWAVESSPGRVWQAIRENEQRVEVLGLRPRAYKLQAFVLSSTLAAAGGIVYMLLYSGSTLARDAAELHADAAADGRDRRRRLALGRGARRHPLHVPQRPARSRSAARRRCEGCRTCCGRRSSSRSSCSASSSS